MAALHPSKRLIDAATISETRVLIESAARVCRWRPSGIAVSLHTSINPPGCATALLWLLAARRAISAWTSMTTAGQSSHRPSRILTGAMSFARRRITLGAGQGLGPFRAPSSRVTSNGLPPPVSPASTPSRVLRAAARRASEGGRDAAWPSVVPHAVRRFWLGGVR